MPHRVALQKTVSITQDIALVQIPDCKSQSLDCHSENVKGYANLVPKWSGENKFDCDCGKQDPTEERPSYLGYKI